jgi:hypothetical protein
MQIRETIDNPSTASTVSPLEDAIVLVDNAGVALGVRRMKHSIEGAPRREAQARPTSSSTAHTGARRLSVTGSKAPMGVCPAIGASRFSRLHSSLDTRSG